MAQEGIEENSSIGPISWSDPHLSTTYNEEAHDPFFSSPYKALAVKYVLSGVQEIICLQIKEDKYLEP